MANSFIITDDHKVHAAALGTYLENTIKDKCLGSFNDVKTTLDYLKCNSLPTYAIIDINLGKDDGIELIKTIKATYKTVRIICYSMYTSPGYVAKAKKAGAHGYVSKTAPEEELIKCISAVVGGGSYIEKALQQNFEVYTDITLSPTKREIEIAELVQQNLNNKQIAERLNISRNTVANYIANIYEKILGIVDNTSEEDKRQKLMQTLNVCVWGVLMNSILKKIIFCILAVAGNVAVAFVALFILKLPIFFDTIFTTAILFAYGLPYGLAVSLLTGITKTICFDYLYLGNSVAYYMALYYLAGLAIQGVNYLCIRKKDFNALDINHTVLILSMTAFLSALASCFTAGTINFVLNTFVINKMYNVVEDFVNSLAVKNFSLWFSCVAGRIPVTVLDRFIATFAAFFIVKVFTKLLSHEK